jgi:SpoVK/Ycf46/Vps4 family AAA+-type ATPase
MVYRVESSTDFGLDVTITEDLGVPDDPTLSEWEQTCPGYKQMLDNLLFLSQLKGVAAPSGVLLTGCAGVGKSRLVSAVCSQLSCVSSASRVAHFLLCIGLLFSIPCSKGT